MAPSTERLLLRRLSAADAPDLRRTTGDPEVMRFWLGGPDPDITAAETRIAGIEAHWKTHGFGDWGVAERAGGRLIGFCGLHHIADMDEVNLGYAFEKASWRKGYGQEACRAVLEFGFRELELDAVVAVIWPDNAASIRLAERLGLRFWKRFLWQGGERVAYRIGPQRL